MTPEEYKKALLDEEERHVRQYNHIKQVYAFNNNPYAVGDVITDKISGFSIRIRRIDYLIGSDLPHCKYFGTELKANGDPKKRQRNTMILQPRAKSSFVEREEK